MARKPFGVMLEEQAIQDLKLLGAKDRHSVNLLIRDAVDLYLEKRHEEINELRAKDRVAS